MTRLLPSLDYVVTVLLTAIFLQIFGGVEDTHKTLVKKATQKTPERDKEKENENEEERGSSVYDSRSSLRR